MSANKAARSGSKGRGPKSAGKGQGRNSSGGGPNKGRPGGPGHHHPPTAPAAAATPTPAPAAAAGAVAPPTAPSPAAAPAVPTSRKLKTAKRLSTAKQPGNTKRLKTSGRSQAGTRVVVRHIDPRSAFKMSALFYLSLSIALLVAAVLLWAGANAVGLVANLEAFMDEVGFTDFQLRTGQFLKASVITSIVFTLAGSLANLLMAVLYNLISDTFGGIEVVLGDDRPDPKA